MFHYHKIDLECVERMCASERTKTQAPGAQCATRNQKAVWHFVYLEANAAIRPDKDPNL